MHLNSEIEGIQSNLREYLKQIKEDNNLSYRELNQILEKEYYRIKLKKDAELKQVNLPETVNYDKFALDDVSNETVEDFKKWNFDMVQKAIDFVNSHPDLKECIYRKQKDMEYTTEHDGKEMKWIPDISFVFSVDGLADSINNEKWVPTSDTYMGYMLGKEQHIIFIM